ncbi:FUSC family protein [Kitasatospora sp. NPDC059646]|uniref:FUSC family protein n=1 Tax=Kitasatospora sp. NPDC059646 TaxID=3346893 RepID=UPI0036C67F77
MFRSRPAPRPTAADRPRRARELTRVLSPRGALALDRVDGALRFALRAALAMALSALPLVAAGEPRLAVYAMLGVFTTTFGRNLPYRRRARVLAGVALAITGAVACGSALAVAARPVEGGPGAVAVVAATALVAGVAKFCCDTLGLRGLGAVLLLFAFTVAANGAATAARIGPQTAAAAFGAATAWLLALSGLLWHRDHPQRMVTATALRAVADLLDRPGPDGTADARARYRATAAVLQAYSSLGARPPADRFGGVRGGVCLRLADTCWSLLVRSAYRPPTGTREQARRLRSQAGLLADGRYRSPVLVGDLSKPARPAPPAAAAAPGQAVHPVSVPASGFDAALHRTAELRSGADRASRRAAVFAVPALRMTLGTAAAGGLALVLGLGHGYWAAISAAAVLHSVSVRTTAHRAVQRTVGTLAGLLIALAVLATGPGPVALVLVIVVLEFLLEYLVVRNYALAVVFLTPLALLMNDLVTPTGTVGLLRDRALGSVLGIGVGLLCALLVVHDRAAVRVERALAACTDAMADAERARTRAAAAARPEAQVRLAAALVELHEASDAAAGELWESGIDPVRLAAAEQRAYLLLNQLSVD